jgi:DNA-binding response OmpR family regulator
VATLLLVTSALSTSTDVLPALGLLPHTVRVASSEPAALLTVADDRYDAVLVDARQELMGARQLCRLLRATGLSAPLVAVVGEGGLVAVSVDWEIDDVLLDTAGPAEVDARLRLAAGRRAVDAATDESAEASLVNAGELTIDEHAYIARLRGRALDLTYKEFELLKFLAQHPGRVFTRAHLLQEVWGYDYYGGTRTVDVHVRRLRAKLGSDHEAMIGTVRNVGYKFVSEPAAPLRDGVEDGETAAEER